MKRVSIVLNNIGDYHAARLADLADRLAARDDRLLAIEASPTSRFYTHKQRRNQRLRTRFDTVSLVGRGRLPIRLWRVLAQEKPTHIFTIGYSDELSAAALVYAKLTGVRIFFMADSKADDQPRRRAMEMMKSAIICRFDGALVAGDRHRAYFRSLGAYGPIAIGYDVIDNAFFAQRAARLAGWLPRFRRRGWLPKRYLLCVSRLVDRKRVDLVLRAYAASNARRADVGLVIIGSGPCEAELCALAREHGIADRVKHFRNVSNSLMPLFYSAAEGLLLLSDYDQWGLCVNEAMVLGVPCIVTRRCGVAGEIVLDGETGFVCETGSVDDAVQAVDALLRDPALRERMSAAAVSIMRNWDLQSFSESILNLTDLQ